MIDTNELFGVQFVINKHIKPRLFDDFGRWKTENQFLQAQELNERALVEKIVKKHREDYPDDDGSPGEISFELWEKLKREVARIGWQNVYDDELGDEQAIPDYEGAPYIYIEDIRDLFYDYNCRHFYFTDSGLEECEKEAAASSLDPLRLQLSDNCKRQINFEKNNFIRYQKKGPHIVALSGEYTQRQEHGYLLHTFLTLDLRKKVESLEWSSDPVATQLKVECEKDFGDFGRFEKRSRDLLCKMINYLELAPIKDIDLPGGGPLDARSSKDQETPIQGAFPMTYVTASWNSTLHIASKWVRPHKKRVLYGKNWSLVKTVDIATYFREAYDIPARRQNSA
jgi:hypothetical protein